MYAIINCSGKQEKVVVGDRVKVDTLNVEAGSTVEFTVSLIGTDDGKIVYGAAVKNSKVKAEVLYSGKGKKLTIFTYKAKKNVRRKMGHRQGYTEVQIKEILA